MTICINYPEALVASVNVKVLFTACHLQGVWLGWIDHFFSELHKDFNHVIQQNGLLVRNNSHFNQNSSKQSEGVTQKRAESLLMHTELLSQVSAHFHFIW